MMLLGVSRYPAAAAAVGDTALATTAAPPLPAAAAATAVDASKAMVLLLALPNSDMALPSEYTTLLRPCPGLRLPFLPPVLPLLLQGGGVPEYAGHP